MTAATLDPVITVAEYVLASRIGVVNHARENSAQYLQNYALPVILRNAFRAYLDSTYKELQMSAAAAVISILVVQYVIIKKVAYFIISLVICLRLRAVKSK